MEDILSELSNFHRKNIPVTLVTVVASKGSTPRHPGAKMIVKGDGSIIGTIGGANLEFLASKEALTALEDGKTRKVTYLLYEDNVTIAGEKQPTGMICGGEVELFFEPLVGAPILYLFGAGHVAKPTAHIAALCGFTVRVFDQRAEMATKDRFPEAGELIVDDLTVASQKIEPVEDSYAVIVTAGHDTDYAVLKNVLKKPFYYIGVICSRRKKKILLEKLAQEGFSEEIITKIHTPIGLDIGSETPEEIAVSIVAELIKVKNLEKNN
jgi:xanthine dehydrogenase accessory factor